MIVNSSKKAHKQLKYLSCCLKVIEFLRYSQLSHALDLNIIVQTDIHNKWWCDLEITNILTRTATYTKQMSHSLSRNYIVLNTRTGKFGFPPFGPHLEIEVHDHEEKTGSCIQQDTKAHVHPGKAYTKK